MNGSTNTSFTPGEWIPRILIGVAILLLIYFTQVTHRFKGTYDESFLAPSNLELIRGPLAHEDYYRMGELDYKGKIPFAEELPLDMRLESATSELEIPIAIDSNSATGQAGP